jgi:hypothetical protein
VGSQVFQKQKIKKNRIEEIGDGGIFVHSKLGMCLETHLGIPEDKQLPGTLCLAPHVIMGDKAFPLKTCLLKPHPGSQSKGDNEKTSSIICFPDPGYWWKMHLEY